MRAVSRLKLLPVVGAALCSARGARSRRGAAGQRPTNTPADRRDRTQELQNFSLSGTSYASGRRASAAARRNVPRRRPRRRHAPPVQPGQRLLRRKKNRCTAPPVRRLHETAQTVARTPEAQRQATQPRLPFSAIRNFFIPTPAADAGRGATGGLFRLCPRPALARKHDLPFCPGCLRRLRFGWMARSCSGAIARARPYAGGPHSTTSSRPSLRPPPAPPPRAAPPPPRPAAPGSAGPGVVSHRASGRGCRSPSIRRAASSTMSR